VLSARLARMNRRGLNRITGRFAHRLPGFGIVHHIGRRSGRALATPLNVFRKPEGGFIIALTYGPDTDWLRNITAAGGCTITTRGVSHRLVNPRVIADPNLSGMPPVVRSILRLNHVQQFLHLDPAPPEKECDEGRPA
jgi:deazaflavin-dependent oxidoreductase (nitroreductase family)